LFWSVNCYWKQSSHSVAFHHRNNENLKKISRPVVANTLERTNRICRSLWENSIYTGFAMYEYLVRLSGQTMEAVENPFSNLEEEMTETNDAAQEELEEVWTGGDEMCTPYCIGSGLHTAMHQDVHIPSPPVHIFSNSSCQLYICCHNPTSRKHSRG
jgi:hypothetical protein